MERRTLLKAGALAGLSALFSGLRPAEALPEGNLSMIVPYPAGGISDARSRLVADQFAANLKRNIVTMNEPGAAGVVAINKMRTVAPNGLTLISFNSSGLVAQPQLSPVEFAPLSVITPVACLFLNPTAIIVAKDSPYKSLDDLIADAKARPNAVTYATIGINSVYHLMGEALNLAAGIKLLHVPYTGAAQYTLDLLAGRISFVIGTLGTAMNNREQVRALALGKAERSPLVPEIPTTVELGFPDLIMPDEAGVATRLGTSPDIMDELSGYMKVIADDPAVKQRALKMGLEIHVLDWKQSAQILDRQYKHIGDLIARSGLKKSAG